MDQIMDMEDVEVEIRKTSKNWKEFLCGWGAAIINVSITYPINKIIFRQMLHGVNTTSAYLELKNEGIHYLYRGMLPPLCQKTLSMSIMFGVYEEVRQPLHEVGFNSYLAKASGAMVAGTTEAILMPFERIQTLLSDSYYHDKLKNSYHAFKVVGTQYGIREYYRGLVPILFRNGPSNIGFFILRDEVHSILPDFDNHFKRTSAEFVCGASIGLFLSTLFYPLNVLKIAMQTKLGGDFENGFQVLKLIYAERGFRGLYHGVQMNCSRAFISWGIMNTAYENLKKIIY